jgi:RNA polymerase sigma factor (sigma-70 family)
MYPEDGVGNGDGAEGIAARATLTDAQLVSAIAAGDREAERVLVARYMPRVRAMLLARSRNLDLTADLVQDVMLGAICALRRSQLREATKLSAFVLAIARNVLNNYYRDSVRTPLQLEESDLVADMSNPSHQSEEQMQETMALNAIESLDLTDRLILQMTLVDGLKPGVIAKQLSMRPDLVRQRKLRATKHVINFVQRLSQNNSQATL